MSLSSLRVVGFSIERAGTNNEDGFLGKVVCIRGRRQTSWGKKLGQKALQKTARLQRLIASAQLARGLH
jgi:hypothetical protein